MSKLSGTYTLKIADQQSADGVKTGGTVLTVTVVTSNENDANNIAGVIGRELDKLGLTFPDYAAK